MTLLPFVIPPVVLVFGLIRAYSRPPVAADPHRHRSTLLLVSAYVVLSLPYMYRSVDTGLRSIDVRSLTEAAQSLGANWFGILWRIILPNLGRLLSGAFLTLAIVIGEFTIGELPGPSGVRAVPVPAWERQDLPASRGVAHQLRADLAGHAGHRRRRPRYAGAIARSAAPTKERARDGVPGTGRCPQAVRRVVGRRRIST